MALKKKIVRPRHSENSNINIKMLADDTTKTLLDGLKPPFKEVKKVVSPIKDIKSNDVCKVPSGALFDDRFLDGVCLISAFGGSFALGMAFAFGMK